MSATAADDPYPPPGADDMARKKPATKPKKGKPAPADDDEDEPPVRGKGRAVEEDEPDDEPEAPKKPRSDVYVGLAAITLVALIAATVFYYLDSDASAKKTLSPPQVTVNELKTSLAAR